jgi:hypothetical protein
VRTSQNGELLSSGEKESFQKSFGSKEEIWKAHLSTDAKQNDSGEKSFSFVAKNFAEDQAFKDPTPPQNLKRQEILMHSEQKVHSRRELLNNQFMTPLGKRDRKLKTNDDYEYGSEIFRNLTTPKTHQHPYSGHDQEENFDSEDGGN